MPTLSPAPTDKVTASRDALLAQFARLLDNATELGQLTAEMDDLIDDARLIALNAALESRRAEQGNESFRAIAEQLNDTVDRLVSGKTAIEEKLRELRSELEDGPAETVRESVSY